MLAALNAVVVSAINGRFDKVIESESDDRVLLLLEDLRKQVVADASGHGGMVVPSIKVDVDVEDVSVDVEEEPSDEPRTRKRRS